MLSIPQHVSVIVSSSGGVLADHSSIPLAIVAAGAVLLTQLEQKTETNCTIITVFFFCLDGQRRRHTRLHCLLREGETRSATSARNVRACTVLRGTDSFLDRLKKKSGQFRCYVFSALTDRVRRSDVSARNTLSSSWCQANCAFCHYQWHLYFSCRSSSQNQDRLVSVYHAPLIYWPQAP